MRESPEKLSRECALRPAHRGISQLGALGMSKSEIKREKGRKCGAGRMEREQGKTSSQNGDT